MRRLGPCSGALLSGMSLADAPRTETEVEVRGARLALDRTGEGRPVLWGHGLTSSRAKEERSGLFDWRPVVAAGFEVIRFDARSHGRSEAVGDIDAHRWPSLAQDLLGLADALGVSSFVAGGASMGCATSIHAAMAAPERIEALVLACPPTAWESRARQAGLYSAAAGIVETDGIAALAEAMADVPPPALFADEPELRRFDPDVEESALPLAMRGAAASDLPSLDVLRQLAQPALVLAWTDDPGHPVSTAESLAEALPDAELQVADTLGAVRAWPSEVARWLATTGGAPAR